MMHLSQSVLAAISPAFGMQTADDSLVSQDDETASDDKRLDICPSTLVNLIATLYTLILPDPDTYLYLLFTTLTSHGYC
jgi:hypothetical protein